MENTNLEASFIKIVQTSEHWDWENSESFVSLWLVKELHLVIWVITCRLECNEVLNVRKL